MAGSIVPLAELGPPIGVMGIDDDVGGIEQDDQVLCQIGDEGVPRVASSCTPRRRDCGPFEAALLIAMWAAIR